MNWLLVILLLAAIYFLLEAGLVFFALIVGVALLLGLIASWISSRREADYASGQQPSPPPSPPQFEKQDHEELQKTWMTVGMVFNAVGKGVYKFLRYGFQPSGKKYG